MPKNNIPSNPVPNESKPQLLSFDQAVAITNEDFVAITRDRFLFIFSAKRTTIDAYRLQNLTSLMAILEWDNNRKTVTLPDSFFYYKDGEFGYYAPTEEDKAANDWTIVHI